MVDFKSSHTHFDTRSCGNEVGKLRYPQARICISISCVQILAPTRLLINMMLLLCGCDTIHHPKLWLPMLLHKTISFVWLHILCIVSLHKRINPLFQNKSYLMERIPPFMLHQSTHFPYVTFPLVLVVIPTQIYVKCLVLFVKKI